MFTKNFRGFSQKKLEQKRNDYDVDDDDDDVDDETKIGKVFFPLYNIGSGQMHDPDQQDSTHRGVRITVQMVSSLTGLDLTIQ